VGVAPADVVDEDAPRAGKREAEEHVVGDEVREVVALVRRAGDRGQSTPRRFAVREHEREQRERRRVVHRARRRREVDALEAGRMCSALLTTTPQVPSSSASTSSMS
jgi:hypothetical protein